MEDDQRAAAFDALYRAHSRLVVAYLLRRTPAEEARDLAAEVFTVAWRRLDEVPTHAAAWLLLTARHLLSNARRGERRRLALVERVGITGRVAAASDHAGIEHGLDLRRAMAGLSGADRELLCLIGWEELSPGEAAVVLGCSAATVRVRLHRARQRLAVLLAADDPLQTSQDSPGGHSHG